MQTILDHTPHGIAVMDGDLRLLAWNHMAAQVLDLPEEFLARPGIGLADVLRYNAERGEYGPGDPEQQVRERIELALRFEPHDFERTRPDGRIIHVSGRPLPGGGFVTLYSDVTARRMAEIELQSSHARYRQLLDLLSEGIVVHRRGLIEFVNEAALRILRASTANQLIGRPVIDFVAPDLRDRAAARMAEILRRGGRARTAQLAVLALDGETIPVETEAVQFEDGDGPAVQVVFRDISARHRTEMELRRARDQAEAASRAKSDFLANMSHELRTPLNAIIGFAEVMTGRMFGELSGRYAEYAQDIRDSGQHLLSMINDILDLSKAEAGKLELHDEPVSLPAIVESCQRLLGERARQSGITITVDMAPLPQVLADARLLKQVMLNLLSNAVKFTPAGGRVEVAAEVMQGFGLLVSVSDTGIGIEPRDLEKVLQPFQQADSALTRKHGGTGLGLPLARSMVQLHGGDLDIASVPGQGTIVRFHLPERRLLTKDD
ncbi:MAG: PAS-domain containing protein [Alphaproteobacteria bacterium]|nr:PAS-domain containing protein [Alphaproteobacteria bacterium]